MQLLKITAVELHCTCKSALQIEFDRQALGATHPKTDAMRH